MGAKLNREQIDKLRIYLTKLDEMRGKIFDWSDEDLALCTSIYGIIEKFGDGDPIKAAIKHREVLEGVAEAIRLSGSDRSTALH